MSVPSHQTENNLATEAYKQFGIASPTSAQLTRATTYMFDIIKQEIMNLGREWAFLRREAYLPTTVNVSKIQAPTDFSKLITAQCLDGSRRGTAQAGASTTLTLAAADSGTEGGTEGQMLVLTGGTGANQCRQIKDFDSSSKVATVDEAWATTPSTDTTYLVADSYEWMSDYPVYRREELSRPDVLGRPRALYHMADDTSGDFYFDTVPDKIYGINLLYYSDLRKMDTDTTVDARYSRVLVLLSDLFILGTRLLLEQDDHRAMADNQDFQRKLTQKAAQWLYPNNANQDTTLSMDAY